MYHDRGFAGLPEKQHPSLRYRMRSHRARKYGLFPQRLLVSHTQLDKLEERGYRGHRPTATWRGPDRGL